MAGAPDATQDKSALSMLGATVVASTVACLVGWVPLAAVPKFINETVAQVGPIQIFSVCAQLQVGSVEMQMCSAMVALVAIVSGPAMVGIALFLFRRQLRALGKAIFKRMPPGTRFLGGPVVATLAFVVGWAGIHYNTWRTWGVLPHILFPVVVGVFTHITSRYLAGIQASLGGFFAARDKIPKWLRWILVLAVPMLASVVLIAMFSVQGRVQQEALTEQLVVIIALTTGFLALVPRQGDLLSAAKKELEEVRRG